MRICKHRLYGAAGYRARCTVEYGTAHSHHDHTAEDAARAELAECEPGSHDWDEAGGGVLVCDLCHLVRELSEAEYEREKGDDDGVEYADPRDAQAERLKGED